MPQLKNRATELNWIIRLREIHFPEEARPTGQRFDCTSYEDMFVQLCRRRETARKIEYKQVGDELLIHGVLTTSDNVYPGRYAKNSYLILSCRSDSGMDDCRHARKSKYSRWRRERKNLKIIQKHRKKCLKRGGHFLLLTEIRLLNSFGSLRDLTLEELALSIQHVEKFGDHRDGSKPFSIIAYLCVHSETVLKSVNSIKENQIKVKKENTKFKKIAGNLAFLAEKFGPQTSIAEALERIEGANVIDLNERKVA